MSNPEFLGLLMAIVGCFIGLAGWLSGRDKKIANDAEWKGSVSAQLNSILTSQLSICSNVDSLEKDVKDQDKRLVKVEESTKSAHHRLDDFGKRLDKAHEST